MKNILYTTILLLLVTLTTNAQVRIAYDKAGNRISYQLIVEPVPDTLTHTLAEGKNKTSAITLLETTRISIYPNPTSNQLLIDTKQEGSYTLLLYDMEGKLMRKEQSTEAQHTMDLSSYHTGYYILEINSGKQSAKWKVLKQ